MSKSEDNTSELESYGVWVKNPSDKPAQNESITDTTADSSLDSLDLPEFDDTNFSDMFSEDLNDTDSTVEQTFDDDNTSLTDDELLNITNTTETIEEPAFEATEADAESVSEPEVLDNMEATTDDVFADENDSTLTTDELMNITNTSEVEETITDEQTFDDIADFGETTESVETFETEPAITEENIEETSIETEPELSEEESAFAEAGIEEFNSTQGSHIQEVTIEPDSEISNSSFEEITFDDIDEPAVEKIEKKESHLAPGEEEISLDDFLEDGFSDESVASGNNGYEPGMEPQTESVDISDFTDSTGDSAPAPSASGSEEISLDDFGVSFDDVTVENDSAPKTSEVSFTSSEPVEEEPVLNMDISFDDSTDTIETEDNTVASDSSDFIADDTEDFIEEETSEVQESEPEEEVYVADTSNVSTEEVDLSDFGISSDYEEKNVKQNVEEKKAAETVVDYDLAIGDEESSSAAPVVNEIIPSSEETTEEEPVSEPKEQTESVSTSLLQQIVADLSGLKDEINKLKSNLEEIRENENKRSEAAAPQITEAPVENVVIPEEPVIEETSVDIPEETTVEIPAEDSIDITEETSIDIPSEDTATDNASGFFSDAGDDDTIALSAEELSNIEVEPETTEDDFNNDINLENNSEESGFFGDSNEDDTIALSGDELTNIMNTSEVIESSEALPTEDNFDEPTLTDEPADTDSEETVSEEVTEFDDDADSELTFNFEETNLEEPDMEDIALDQDTDELPDEISIPKEEESIFVESNNSDFMESVHDITEDSNNSAEDISGIKVPTEEEIELPETIDEEEIFNTQPAAEEPVEVIENVEEPVIEETSVDIPEETTYENPLDMTFESPDGELSNDFVEEEAPAEETETVEETTEEVVEEPVIEESTEVISEEPIVEDTIEVEITEEPVIEESTEEIVEEPVFEETNEVITEEPVIEESTEVISEEPVFEDSTEVITEEPAFEEAIESEITEEPVFEDSTEVEITEEPIVEESTEELVEEPVFEETTEVIAEEPLIADSTEAEIAEETIVEEPVEEDSAFDIFDSNIDEEPQNELTEQLSEDSDIMSVDALSKEVEEAEKIDISDANITFPTVDSFNDIEDSPVTEETAPVETVTEVSETTAPAASDNSDSFDTVDSIFEENTEEEIPVSVEVPQEPQIEETSVSEEEVAAVSEPVAEEKTIESDFAEVDNLDNKLSNDNLDYLKAGDASASDNSSAQNDTSDLKQDIKSVLLYMDQLLENLPENKIMEFAKSDEFVTYKKLFSELGLS